MSISGASIIIPTSNRADLLRGTLSSLMLLERPTGCEVEIIVIDNNCTDETAQVVAELSASSVLPLRHIREAKQGLNYCRNRGLHDARHEMVVFFDDDVKVEREWLLRCEDARHKLGAACIAGPVEPWFETDVPAYINERVLGSLTSAYSRKGPHVVLLDQGVAHEIPGSNFAVLRKTALEVGGFDNELDRSGKGMLAGGDWEFGRRWVKAGQNVAYVPGCLVHHFISADKMSRRGLRRRWFGLGMTDRAMLARYPDMPSVSRMKAVWKCFGNLWHSILCSARSEVPAAFENELIARRWLGYVVG